LRRPRLEERLDDAFGRRLTIVVAGPGFGKSTLLASWCSDVATAWHSLSEGDAEVARLARGLGERLAAWLPEPVPVPSAVRRGGDAAARGRERADAYAAALSEALAATLAHDLVLVVDDAHEVGAGSGAARLLESLSKQLPPLVHLILSSRERAPFQVERLRGRGDLLELTGRDLGFTADELAALAATMGLTLDDTASGRVHDATGGWPAAVRLALEALLRTPMESLDASLERIAKPEGGLYEYLAEEVFAHEEPAVLELLRKTAPFERVNAELCAALGCEARLAELVRSGLAVEHADGWVTLHGLVREFVTSAWPLDPSERVAVERRAAAWFEDHGQEEEGLRSLAALGDDAEIARLLSRRGPDLLARGGAESVVRYAEQADVAALDRRAEEAIGEAYTVLGDSERALDHLRRAAADDAELPASVAWRTVAALHLRDDLDAASAVRERARLDSATPFDRAQLFAWSAAVERRLGRLDETSRLAEQALAEAERSGDDRALALALTAAALAADGTVRDPLAYLARALAAAERCGDVFQRARIHNNRGSILLESGEYESAIDELGAALRLAALGGFTTLAALATMNRGLCHFCLGRLDDAAADYDAAARLYRRTGSRELAYAVVGLGDVHRERGDLARARGAYEEGLALAEESGDRQALVPALYQLAKVLVDDEPERALELTERAISYGWPDRAWAYNAHGWVLLARGERERAADSAERATALARQHRDPFGLAEAAELSALSAADDTARRRLLEEALSLWRSAGNAVHEAGTQLAIARLSPEPAAHRAEQRAERRLRSLGVRVSATGPAGLLRFVADRREAPLAIETLGGFRVVRAGTPVPHAEWQSQKARDVLKILVARRGAATPRELLMDALWPDGEPSKLGNRLSVALSTVHSVLDPARAHASDYFVWADKRAVGLDLSHVVVDVEEFLAEAAEGLGLRSAGSPAAGDRLEHAFALYRGDFLEGDAYEEWAASLREEARAAYLHVARALAADASEAGLVDDAIRYSLRILDHDPYDEHAHLQLVGSLVSGGRHGEARRRYGVYCTRMEEIGVESAAFPA
jgi:ATP/maltotriose-dependent transcriptional regulator MalT/DNA-binding SARP family transcriptional activator